jgi:hypothetical protein
VRPLRRLVAIAVVALATPFACTDPADDLTGPRGPFHDFDPGPSDPGPSGSYAIPTPPGNVPGVPSQLTGITIPAYTPVRLTITGILNFSPNPQYAACAGDQGPQPPWGYTLGPAGWSQSPYPYRVTLSPSHGYEPKDPQAGTVIGYYFGSGGGLWVGRPSSWGYTCWSSWTGTQPQFLLSGGQTVSAEILAPAEVTADRTTVVAGDTVYLTLTIPWTTNFVVNTGWSWVKDSSSSPNAVAVGGCGHQTTCAYRVYGDGHAQVSGIVAENEIPLTGVGERIHVAPTHLTLVVDSAHVASGSEVKFTARRADAQPVAVQSWVWTPGPSSPPGPEAVGCAGGDSVCVTALQNTSPPESSAAQTGTMTAWAILGTASESASVAVTVDPAPPDTGGGCNGPSFAASGGSSPSRTSPTLGALGRTSLDCGGGGGGGTAAIALTPHTASLYPRVRALWVNGDSIPEHEPDTVRLQVAVTLDGNPAPGGTAVTLRAEFLPNSGGHAHVMTALPFTSAPAAESGPEQGTPVVGYFLSATGQKLPDLHLLTNGTDTITTKLVAGYLGGQARVIASVYVGEQLVRDTAVVTYAVPGLVRLSDYIAADVYWIGGTSEHPQGDNFYVQSSLSGALQGIAESLKVTSPQALYVQYNDASLPDGGPFTVSPGLLDDPVPRSPSPRRGP